MHTGLTIGKVAKAAGVNVETIRFYQRIGLVSEPKKPFQGFRYYPPEAPNRVRFIKRAQQLGFTLEEVKGLLALGDGGSCRQTEQLASRKLALVEARIADLERLRGTLKELIGRCEAGGDRIACPIIDTLAADG